MRSWFKMKLLFHYALIVGILFFFISFCVNGIRSFQMIYILLHTMIDGINN